MGYVLSVPIDLNNWDVLKKEAIDIQKAIIYSDNYSKYVALKKRWDYIMSCMATLAWQNEQRAAWIDEMQLIMRRLVRKYDIQHKTTLDSKEEPLLGMAETSEKTFLDEPFGADLAGAHHAPRSSANFA
jgi:hypothetical protein